MPLKVNTLAQTVIKSDNIDCHSKWGLIENVNILTQTAISSEHPDTDLQIF